MKYETILKIELVGGFIAILFFIVSTLFNPLLPIYLLPLGTLGVTIVFLVEHRSASHRENKYIAMELEELEIKLNKINKKVCKK